MACASRAACSGERAAVDEDRLLQAVSPDEARSRGLAYIDSLGDTPKAARMREVFTAYMDGQALDEVSERGNGKRRASVRDFLERSTSKTWKKDKARVLKLVAGL